MRRTALAIGLVAALAAGCSDGKPSGTSEPQAPYGETPRPEDSATPGPLPKPGAPATRTDNPTGTGTGR